MTDKPPTDDKPDKFTSADLVEFILERYDVGRTAEGLLFAVSTAPAEARVAKELKSLRPEISRTLFRERRVSVGREMISAALETLAGFAADVPVSNVYLRAAGRRASVCVDLGTRDGAYVEVSAHGWEVRRSKDDADGEGVIFRRTAATTELPEPAKGGTRDQLRALLGLDADDARWRLLWGWLVASVFENVPRPILWTLGPQGSGKSTRARMVLNVVDPAEALGREPGKSERDDTTAALGRFVPSWDNIGSVSAATSDWLCRLTTGVEIGRRALYSDDDLRVSTLRRTAVATSIVLPFGLGPDALERLVLVEFDRVPEEGRRPERDLWEEFYRARPMILGALLDDVAGVLKHLGAVREQSRPLPRMADYAQLLYALDEHAGEPDDDGFAEAYVRSVRAVMADRAQSDPLTAALLKHVKRHDGTWKGPNASLYQAISADRPDDPRAGWLTGPTSLGAALLRAQETLRAAGLIVSRGKSNGARWIRLEAIPCADEDADESSAA